MMITNTNSSNIFFLGNETYSVIFKHRGENCLIVKPKTHVVLDFISGVTNLE